VNYRPGVRACVGVIASVTAVVVAGRATGAVAATRSTPPENIELTSVSCVPGDFCLAVGSYETPSGTGGTVAEMWKGKRWVIQVTPNPKGSLLSVLSGVSCTSPTACVAVGNYTSKATTTLSFAERWNGTKWTVETTVNPKATTQSGDDIGLSAVACTAATSCLAVGFGGPSESGGVLTERWNGHKWTLAPTFDERDVSGLLYGVSCASDVACSAVGAQRVSNGYFVPLAERWNGTRWIVQATPLPKNAAGFTQLQSVSCSTVKSCTAVGIYENEVTNATLVERWNGSKWLLQSTARVAGTLTAGFEGVSCVGATACMAVGAYSGRTPSQSTLAEAWNGTRWFVKPTPNPKAAAGPVLYGISCTASNACTAVGYYLGRDEWSSFAERWNGRTWKIETMA